MAGNTRRAGVAALLAGCALIAAAAWPATTGKQVLLVATANTRGVVRGCG